MNATLEAAMADMVAALAVVQSAVRADSRREAQAAQLCVIHHQRLRWRGAAGGPRLQGAQGPQEVGEYGVEFTYGPLSPHQGHTVCPAETSITARAE